MKYCIVSCGHNFYTSLDKRVGQMGECDKCEGYPEVRIVEIEELEKDEYVPSDTEDCTIDYGCSCFSNKKKELEK